jgi:hypothetical protein
MVKHTTFTREKYTTTNYIKIFNHKLPKCLNQSEEC